MKSSFCNRSEANKLWLKKLWKVILQCRMRFHQDGEVTLSSKSLNLLKWLKANPGSMRRWMIRRRLLQLTLWVRLIYQTFSTSDAYTYVHWRMQSPHSPGSASTPSTPSSVARQVGAGSLLCWVYTRRCYVLSISLFLSNTAAFLLLYIYSYTISSLYIYIYILFFFSPSCLKLFRSSSVINEHARAPSHPSHRQPCRLPPHQPLNQGGTMDCGWNLIMFFENQLAALISPGVLTDHHLPLATTQHH